MPDFSAPDRLFVSLENWDEVWRRNQFLCAGWSKRHPDGKTLFVTPPRIVPRALQSRDWGSLRPKLWRVPDLPNIWIYRPLRLVPSTLRVTNRGNEAHERAQVRAVARRIGLQRPLLWINSHFAAHFAGRMNERALIYDVTDDWIAFAKTEALRARIATLDEQLCRRADATIVCSSGLFDLKKSLARRLALVPNGVDAAHYERVGEAALSPHPLTQGWTRPVLGYTGTLHPDRLDLPLVDALCRAFPNATVALVGPDLLLPSQRAALQRHPNLAMTGAVPYSQLPDVMRAFDVCLAPHLESAFVQSLNPLKLWEYLAGGKPIVATNVAGFRDFPALVRLASGASEFVAACRAALAGDDLAQQRREVARRNSWEARLDDIERLLREVRT